MYKRIFQLLFGLIISVAVVSPAMAAQYARPDQTISTGGWADINASSLHAAIDETSPNTSDYIESQNTNDTTHLGLSTVSDPETSSGHIMRIRVNPRDTSSHDVRIRLFQNSGNTEIASYSFTTSTRQWRTFTYTLTTTQANSITNYADLSIRIDNIEGSDRKLWVTWFEFEIPDAPVGTPPTVISPTSTAVTDTTATLGGNVSNDGGLTVTNKGVEWGTTSGVYPNNVAVGSGGTGVFAQPVTGLPAGTMVYFRAWATNSAGTGTSSESSFTTLPTISAPTVSAVTNTTATLGGTVTGVTVTARGTVWGTSPNPTGNILQSGSGSGTFSHARTGLPSGTLIYFRAYASNAGGIAYSADSTFTTKPTVTAPTFASVTDTTATLGGTVSSTGLAAVTDRGTVWGTSPNPTGNALSQGTGNGPFSHARTGLPSYTLIYFRAYATNAGGTSYSADNSFTTDPGKPTVTSPTFANVTTSTATLGGNVANDGGAAVTNKGIEWGTTPGGPYPNNVPVGSGSTGVFTIPGVALPGSGTTVYFRAWAVNTISTGYSAESSFATLATVTAPTVTAVTSFTATLGGTVTSSGGAAVTDRGTVWGTSPNPTGNALSQGTGTGTFTHGRTNLPAGTLIYFRAYATNAGGTAYSADGSFTTDVSAQASGIVIEVVASRSMRFSWTPGTGGFSIVTMRLQATPESAPVDGTDYVAQDDYSFAPQTSGSSGNFVVYKGSESQVTVYGLAENTTFTIAVYDYTGSGAGTDYLQANPPQANETTRPPGMHNLNIGADCGVCHGNHGNSGLVPRGTNQEDVCKTCHNPLGAASAMSDIAIHGTPNHAAADVDCGSCHEVHRISPGSGNTTLSTHPVTPVTDYNRSFVRANVDKYVSTATTDDAVNQTTGEDQAIEGGDATTSRGICQACHTGTDYHRNNSAVAVSQCHKGGTSDSCDGSQVVCTDCHTHSGGFEPSGGCIACHSSTQGGTPPNDRRAVVTEFSHASTHIEFTSLVDDDCVVCHQQSSITPSHSHQDGSLTLWDSDNHSNSGFQLLDHSDPLSAVSEAAKLNNFCLTCHDNNGAQAEINPAAPFTGSIAPVDIATNWAPSSHAMSPVSCLGDGGFGCHGGGHGGEKLNLLAPASPAATPSNFTEEQEGFCFNCHDGSPAGTDIQAQFAKRTNGTDIYHHPVVNSEQSVGREVECNDCHNPHEATNGNKVAGVSGIEFDASAVSSATAEYQVCLKCHGDTYNTSRPRTTNKRTDFKEDRSAFHPIARRGRNRSTAMVNNLQSPWTIDSVMTCNDCHSNNVPSGPQGPHGSTEASILKDTYWKDLPAPSSFSINNFDLCFECHSLAPFQGNSSMSNFASGTDSFHDYHVNTGFNTICATCHFNIHGNENQGNSFAVNGTNWEINGTLYTSPPTGWKTRLVSFYPRDTGNPIQGDVDGCCGYDKPTWAINTNTRVRTCYITCHGKSHGSSETYDPGGQDNDNLALPAGG